MLKIKLIVLILATICLGQIVMKPNRTSHWAVSGGDGVDSVTVLPQSATTVAIGDHSDDDWDDPTYVEDEGSNDASITAQTFDNGDQSYILKAYNFDFSSIPGGSTINGIKVIINARTQADGNHSIDYVSTLNANNNPYGDEKASGSPQGLLQAATSYEWGGSTDLWGRTGFDIDSAQSSNFGVGFGVISNQNNADVFSDYVKIRIFYEEAE